MIRCLLLLLVSLAVVSPAKVFASGEAHSDALPFSAKEDADRARFVWLALKSVGMNYAYLPAKDHS